MLRMKLIAAMILTVLLCISATMQAQSSFVISNPLGKEKKPDQYEDKKLASEKTEDKSFGPLRRIIQNGTSHYNFYFNANNKLQEIIERARLANKDDYSRLLSFYSYSVDNTATQKSDLDSVIYKCTAGILLHDLRTNWVDNFYLMIGESYYLKKDFDSAALVFQFINYNLYPRKKHEDDDVKIVGTNSEEGGTGTVSIADKEKRNIVQKVFTLPESRNDALIWQVRTFTQQQEYGDAAGLISILKNDPNLPHRLRNDLDEVTAYWFYAQNNYDSSAVHLALALSNADTKDDKSRWEYLLAQMYELGGKYDLASQYYKKASEHTADPVMDIYARLNDAKMMRNNGNSKELNNSIATLLRMAKRDRYENYRDIIYYSAGQLSLQAPDTTNGITYYNKSVVYNNPASGYRNKSYLQLANIAYSQRRYRDARSFYDSLNLTGKETGIDANEIASRKEVLGRLIPDILAIEREDSLQKIAALSPAERDAFIRRMVRKNQKANGQKDDDDNDFTGGTIITNTDRNKQPAELFPATGANTGDWYFYNASAKAKGFSDFKAQWGKRDNVDNWRRRTATEAAINKNINTNIDIDATIPQDGKGLPVSPDNPFPGKTTATGSPKPADVPVIDPLSYDGLTANLPLTKELADSSNRTVATNLFNAAQIFQNELEDYPAAIAEYEDYVHRFAAGDKLPEVYFNLAYSYDKIGDAAKAAYYRNLLRTNFAGSDAAKLMANPHALTANQQNPEITAKYAEIYNMFIEGNFDAALQAKKKADSSYGKNYWSPQLLYIEAVYHIRQREDSAAITVLKNIEQLYPTSPLKDKAATLIDVLGRRAQIEKYLTDLQVTREEDDRVMIPDDHSVAQVSKPAPVTPVAKAPTVAITKRVITDSITTPAIYTNKSFTLQPDQPQMVAMILDKVDYVYINEAKNAFTRLNKGNSATAGITITRDTLDPARALLLFAPFENAAAALKYFDLIKKAAPNEISWLQASKYSFIIISDKNLQVLKANKDLGSYKQLINTNFGNRF